MRLISLAPWLLSALCLLSSWPVHSLAMRPSRMAELRRETVEMFYHGFDNYMQIAFPEDEVRVRHQQPTTFCCIRAADQAVHVYICSFGPFLARL